MQSIATEQNILNNNEMTKHIAYYSIIGLKDQNFKAGKCYVISCFLNITINCQETSREKLQ